MKRILITLLAGLFFYPSFTQTGKTITLQECYSKALAVAPENAIPGMLANRLSLREEQIRAEQLPQLQLQAQGSWQSDVVAFPIESPLFAAPELPHFRFSTSVNANYLLYDGGMRDARLEQERAATLTEEQRVSIDLRNRKDPVNQAYFGILLQQARIAVIRGSLSDLATKRQTLEAAARLGVRLASEAERIHAQEIRLNSDIRQAEGTISGLLGTLSQLTGLTLEAGTTLQEPDLRAFAFTDQVARPELDLFTRQQNQIQTSELLLDARRKPKVNAFLQTGLGYPNPLNFFDDKLSPFAQVGVQASWLITDWRQTERDRALLRIQQDLVQTQRESFLDKLSWREAQYRENARALQDMLTQQDELIRVLEAIREESAARLERQVITATDYLGDQTAVEQARLLRETYRLQLLQLQVDYLTYKGLL
ncbi:MAG: TolC family protein [Lewinellaceae bacterium]|nr:TolC family protein [Lewinellaceae bacterium]